MEEDIILKKLNFKARRGIKETTQIINKILCNYKNLSVDEKNELEELLDLNDQDLFDILFKDTLKFKEKFPNIKRYIQ
tara:strand:- start:7948 stop:8181 length:234 start_codon:yes stop_codon:yes gene_type:complete